MKKLLLALTVMMVGMSFTACQDNTPCVTTKTFDVEVKSGEWSYSALDNNNYFFATIEAPEITWDVYDYGQVMVYREWGYNTTSATKKQLPYTLPIEYSYISNEYTYGVDSTNMVVPVDTTEVLSWGFYSETIDFEYTKGQITLFYTASDFDYELDESFMPEDMHFHVVIMYNNK